MRFIDWFRPYLEEQYQEQKNVHSSSNLKVQLIGKALSHLEYLEKVKFAAYYQKEIETFERTKDGSAFANLEEKWIGYNNFEGDEPKSYGV